MRTHVLRFRGTRLRSGASHAASRCCKCPLPAWTLRRTTTRRITTTLSLVRFFGAELSLRHWSWSGRVWILAGRRARARFTTSTTRTVLRVPETSLPWPCVAWSCKYAVRARRAHFRGGVVISKIHARTCISEAAHIVRFSIYTTRRKENAVFYACCILHVKSGRIHAQMRISGNMRNKENAA